MKLEGMIVHSLILDRFDHKPKDLASHMDAAGLVVLGGPQLGESDASVYVSTDGYKEMYRCRLKGIRWYDDADEMGGWNALIAQVISTIRSGADVKEIDAVSFSCEKVYVSDDLIHSFEYNALFGFTPEKFQVGIMTPGSYQWNWDQPAPDEQTAMVQTAVWTQ